MVDVGVVVSLPVEENPPKSVLGLIWWASSAVLLSRRKDGGANVGTADDRVGGRTGAPVSRSVCCCGSTGLNRFSGGIGSATTEGVGLVAMENKSCPNWLNLAKLVEVLCCVTGGLVLKVC